MDNSEIVSRLDSIAEKISAGANYFWPMLVKQQVFEGIASVIIGVILFVIALSTFVLWRKWQKNRNNDVLEICFTCSCILCPFILGHGISKIYTGIMQVNFPELYALKSLIG